MTENSPSRMVLSAPAALYIVGAISFGLFALLTAQVPGSSIRVLNAWTMAAGVGILIAAVIEFKNNMVFATLILVSGSLLALGAGWGFMISAGTDSFIGNVLPSEIWEKGLQMCGWVWLGIGIVQLLILPVAFKLSWGLVVSQIISGVAALMLAFGLVQRVGFGDGIVGIAGWVFLVSGIFAMYTATALLTNAVYGKKKLPI